MDQRLLMIRLKNFALAIIYWFILYFFFSILLYIWKFQTPDEIVNATTTTTTNITTVGVDNTNNTSSASSLLPVLNETDNEILDNTTEQIQNAIQKATSRNNALDVQLKSLSHLRQKLDGMINNNNSNDTANNNDDEKSSSSKSLSTKKLHNLLSINDLSNIKTIKSVEIIFRLAINELKEYVVEKTETTTTTTAEWNTLIDALTSEKYPKKEIINLDETCPETTSTDVNDNTTTTTTTTNTTNTTSFDPAIYLEQVQENIVQLFASQRTNNTLPVSFIETIELLHTALVSATSNITIPEISTNVEAEITETVKQVISTDDDDENCINANAKIEDWVEAGIHAIHRKENIRPALIRAMQKDGIDTTSLILDADLEELSEQYYNDNNNNNDGIINLRTLLDKPILHESSFLIDKFLLAISGYIDPLDEFLDNELYAKLPKDEDGAVGRLFVEKLLQSTSKINIPTKI